MVSELRSEEVGYAPKMISVVWDDDFNPDIRLMIAIQALIDASATSLTDPETHDILAYLARKYEPSVAKP